MYKVVDDGCFYFDIMDNVHYWDVSVSKGVMGEKKARELAQLICDKLNEGGD